LSEGVPPEDEWAWNKAFRPYAMEIGFLLREWNDLQERLASLFTTLLRIPNGAIASAIWYAVPNDRLQRRMLADAASVIYNPSHPSPSVDKKQRAEQPFEAALWEEIKWIVESADYLGSRRDAAAHSPVMLLIGPEPLEFIARHFHDNPIAKSLKGKKLLSEFRLYRDRATTIRHHAAAIEQYILYGQRAPLPERPVWPERADKGKDAKSTRKDRPK
jgi:hypothetical protein